MKVKLELKIKTEEETLHFSTSGILENQRILKYIENGVKVILDLKEDKLTRENTDFILQYKFLKNGETLNDVFLKDYQKTISLAICTHRLVKKENYYLVEYTLLEENRKVCYEVCWRDAF